MTREEILELCRKAPNVGAVKHEEFIDYIVVLEQTRRLPDGRVERTEVAYMSVDGKVAMANEDHRRQGKRLDFEDPVVLVDNDEQLTLLVAVNSELYGRRHGIATSRKIGGSEIERRHPWEVAETSAIGRALSAMGYGVLPGSGLASAEDVVRAREAEEAEALEEPTVAVRPPYRPRRRFRPVSPFQRQKLVELYAEIHPDEEHPQERVEELFFEHFGHSIDEGTYDEGRRLTALLLRQLSVQQSRSAESSG